MINPFPNIKLFYLVYFFYGGAFLVLGLSIIITNMKESNLKLADSLWLLGWFGIIHGAREWLQIYPLIEQEHLTTQHILAVKTISLALLIISFLFLFQFGMSLIFGKRRALPLLLTALVLLIFLIWTVPIWWDTSISMMQVPSEIKKIARNTFGIGSALAAGYGLIIYSREIGNLSYSISRQLYFAGWTFIVYGLFVSRFFLNVIRPLHVPAELFRACTAILASYYIVRALNIFNLEMRRRVEQQTRHLVQAEKLASLGQLAAGIAHEINNPLTNASLGIQTLRCKIKDCPEAARKIDAVEKNIDRASNIANELLLFSRHRLAEFIPVDINKVIEGALTLMNHKFNGIVIRRKLEPVPEVMGDPAKLEQVFINVLSNAVEAMPKGGVISISTFVKKEMVRASITDTGCGIEDEVASRVFDPFFTTKEVGSGTGLGLSISYGIIQRHNGRIKLTSSVGQGTTVTVKIPIRE